MALNGICRKTNELCAPLSELGLQLRESTKLSSADGRVVFWVGEEDDPFIANELYSTISSRHGACSKYETGTDRESQCCPG